MRSVPLDAAPVGLTHHLLWCRREASQPRCSAVLRILNQRVPQKPDEPVELIAQNVSELASIVPSFKVFVGGICDRVLRAHEIEPGVPGGGEVYKNLH